MYNSALLSLLIAGASAAPTALDIASAIIARAPVEANPVLKSVKSTGTGCASNTAAFVFNENASVAFDNMLLSSDGTARTINCLITVEISTDKAWKFTANSDATVLRGWADSPAGKSSDISVRYASGSASNTATCTATGTPGGGDFVCNAKFPTGTTGVSSACGGGVVTIETQLKVASAPTVPWITTIDSEDIGFTYSKC